MWAAVYAASDTARPPPSLPCHLKEGTNITLNHKPGVTAGVPAKPGPTPPPAPTPPPIPPAAPVLGYKPHIVFFLGDDVGHYNMGWRNNSEARKTCA